MNTVDNFISGLPVSEKYFFDFDKNKIKSNNEKKVVGIKKLHINFASYQQNKNNKILNFIQDREKFDKRNEDNLIISVEKKDNLNISANDVEHNYIVQTGNYVGKFFWDSLEINIGSRFSNAFLIRMLNFANDIYLDDVNVSGQSNEDKAQDISKFILYYLFVQSLEKAFLLGLPKAYKTIEHHDMKLRGQIAINAFIKNDIPFKGKISSTSRQQKEIEEIIDVLYKAVKIIDGNKFFSTKNISHIKTHLKEAKSQNFVSPETIKKALNSKALQNPIFSPYKKVLEYAQVIIKSQNIEDKNQGKMKSYGFIINVAELFEIYVTKLLQRSFLEWSVSSPKLNLYQDSKMFFARKIIPDIVMTRDKDVMVFDTKYKRMKMRGNKENGVWDVDRNDFFQINTYMSYFQNQGYNVIAGGLLYPMEEFDRGQCHSDNWLGKFTTKFIIDGLDLSKSENNYIEFEDEFVTRIKDVAGIA
jgi:5-methylcytosine-specific restriction endonuclease McrBC regulatory subunit McrC